MSQVDPKPGEIVYEVVPYLVSLGTVLYDAERWLSYEPISTVWPQAFRVRDESHRKPNPTTEPEKE